MITITEYALDRIAHRIEKRGRGIGIRIGVKVTGCSGLAYVLEYVDIPNDTDDVVACGEHSVYIDPKSSVYLRGLEVDYVRSGLNEGFEFKNPNSKGECGCGESFRV